MTENAIIHADRIFVPLRKAGRRHSAQRAVYHAVTPNCRMALCADEPSASSGWDEPPGDEVTCPLCLKRLERLGPAAG